MFVEVEMFRAARPDDYVHYLQLEILRPDELPMSLHRSPCRGELCFRFLRAFLLALPGATLFEV